jgi:hypothetical protein
VGRAVRRGRFLADLRGLQEQLGVGATDELPDPPWCSRRSTAWMTRRRSSRITPALDKIAAPLNEQGIHTGT